ncbi:uncharacterized protein LOC141889651 [Acropora palmata]
MMNAVCKTMARSTVLLLFLFIICSIDFSLGRPSGKLRIKRQSPQNSALASLMHFSNKLADLERLVTSYDQKIKRQAIQINHLTAQVDSKADRSQIDAMATLLNSKISTVKGEIKTKELVIERNQNQLRNLQADMTEVRIEYNQLLADTTEILNRFDGISVNCRNLKTGWEPKGNGPIMYLERQWVRCHQNEFMQSFVLNLASNYEGDNVRYVYRCCNVDV